MVNQGTDIFHRFNHSLRKADGQNYGSAMPGELKAEIFMFANKQLQGESLSYTSIVTLTRYVTKPSSQITDLLSTYGISCPDSSTAAAKSLPSNGTGTISGTSSTETSQFSP